MIIDVIEGFLNEFILVGMDEVESGEEGAERE